METDKAAEHLQVIRTLMERSALYRRALAPIMIFCGVLGTSGGIAGWFFKSDSNRSFVFFWSSVATLALIGAFLLVRRQALKDTESFWSPPTRRIAQALLPALFIGGFFSLGTASMVRNYYAEDCVFLIMFWAWFYGCAIHSAGFFMVKGMRLFGWGFICSGCALFPITFHPEMVEHIQPHFLMGGLFGGLHLAYGIYLYFTEDRKTAP